MIGLTLRGTAGLIFGSLGHVYKAIRDLLRFGGSPRELAPIIKAGIRDMRPFYAGPCGLAAVDILPRELPWLDSQPRRLADVNAFPRDVSP